MHTRNSLFRIFSPSARAVKDREADGGGLPHGRAAIRVDVGGGEQAAAGGAEEGAGAVGGGEGAVETHCPGNGG